MNAEIVQRLEASFGQESFGSDTLKAFTASAFDQELYLRFRALMERYEALIPENEAKRKEGK